MMFFRTNDTRRDRSIVDGAKQRRKLQLLAQQQMQEAQKAALAASLQAAVAE